ncbi:MAG TPA: hypothetical protein VLF91_01835 [Candidatus Saccharimonadales bacterium]|nr:hypothetical protein [Candidatus Saccharimonadales bacterium]
MANQPVYDPETNDKDSQYEDPLSAARRAKEQPYRERVMNAIGGAGQGETGKGQTDAEDDGRSLADRESAAARGGGTPEGGDGQDSSDAEPKSGGAAPAQRKKLNAKTAKSKVRKYLKKKVFFVVAAVLSAITGGIITLSFENQFLQPIQVAKELEQIWLQNGQNEFDDRLVRMARFVGDPNLPTNYRMGLLGTQFSRFFETKLNANGITSAYTKNFGFLNGYMIDPAKLSGEFSDVGSHSEAAVKDYFQKKYGITLQTHADDPKIPAGKLFASARNVGYFKTKGLVKAMMDQAGYSRITSAIWARNTASVTNSSFFLHPLRWADFKLLKAADRLLTFNKQQNTATENGANQDPITTETNTDPKDKPTTASADGAKNATDEAINELHDAGNSTLNGDTGPLSALQSNSAFKKASGATGIVGIACMAEALGAEYNVIQQAHVLMPMLRLFVRAMGVAGQEMNGSPDMNATLAGYYNQSLVNKQDNTSWADAKSLRVEEGRPGGIDIPSSARIGKNSNVVTQVLSRIPGLKGVCSAVDSNAGQAVTLGLSFLGGPITTIFTTAVFAAVQPYIPQLLGWLAGYPVSALAQGADMGNFMNFGGRIFASLFGASTGGHPLSEIQEKSLRAYQQQQSQQEFQSHGLAYRLFNLYDPRSLAAVMLTNVKPSFTQNVSSLSSGLLGLLPHTMSMMGNLFSAHSAALDTTLTYDYGFPLIGKSIDEQNAAADENPFQNGSNVVDIILPGSDGQKLIDRAAKCNGVTINTNGDVVVSSLPSIYDIADPANNCSDTSDANWIPVQNYIADSEDMQSFACYNGDTTSCANIGYLAGTLTDQPAAASAGASNANFANLTSLGGL